MTEPGLKAPDFKAKALINGEEKEISLSDFKGQKIALYFYPRDMTPGCTTQAENLRDNFKKLEEKNIVIIGVSKDSIKSHQSFKEKKELPFILISDEDTEVNKLYGVWKEKNMYGRKYWGTARTTFLIDENQKIVHVITKPKVSEHSEEILHGFNLL